MEVTSGPPTAFPVGHRCALGVLAGTHRCDRVSWVTLGQSANPSWCACWCWWSRDVVCSLRSRLQKALCKLSIVTILSHCEPKFLRVVDALSNWPPCSRSHQFFLAACSVATHLVHVEAKSVSFSEVSSISNAVASVLGCHCNLRDGIHAVLRVSSVVNIFTVIRVSSYQRPGRSQRRRLCFRMKRR